MNTIDTSQIVDPNVEQPWLGPSLDFLQAANREAFSNAMIGLIGSTYSAAQIYIIWGCIRTGAADGAGAGAAAVSAGAIFFNGEIYSVPAFATANIAGNTLYSAIQITQGAPDPVQFSDLSSKNVHNVRKWVVAQSNAGSNAFSTWINSTWHVVGATGEPAFQNSWTFNTNNVKFKIDASGFVCFEGIATGGASGTTVFTLPVAYRPAFSKRFVAVSFIDNQGVISIGTNGNVVITLPGGAASTYLDNVRFALD